MEAISETTLISVETEILPLHGEAWAAWNASYDRSGPYDIIAEAHRVVGQTLYLQAVHERIQELFARSDAQNDYLDAMLASA
jgi:hypothetical protein